MKISNKFYNLYNTPKGVFQSSKEAKKANNISHSQFYRNLNNPNNLEYFITEVEYIKCKGCDKKIKSNTNKAGYCCNKCRALNIKYGININTFNSMLESQNFKCKICLEEFSESYWGSRSVCVDHCHSTSRVRGLLCSNCNRGIGLLEENSVLFQRAIRYLSNNPLKISKIRDVKTPLRSTPGSAGLDFYIPEDFNPMKLKPGQSINIPSGIKANVPENFMLTAFNKSGVALKGLGVGACVVDSDYQGEIHLHVRNLSTEEVLIEPSTKLVQFILIPILTSSVELVEEKDLYKSTTERGSGGFGSTGTK